MSDKYTVYGKPRCDYCDKAKAMLREQGKPVTYHDVMEDTAARAVLLEAIPNLKTVPQIFHGDHHVGGYTELVAYLAK